MRKLITLSLTALLFTTANAQLITATGSTSVPRMNHSSQLLSNGKVVVFGGYNGNAQSPVTYSSAEIYNNGTWTATGSMTTQRDKVSSALLSNGNILAIGGRDASLNALASCEIYNVSTGTWSATGSLATARANARIVTLNNGKILAAGGQYTTTCELYDQTTNTWTATGSMNVTRDDEFAMTKLPDGRVLATGGNNSATAEIYDPATGVWTSLSSSMTVARQGHQSILMTNNKVLIAGGDFTLTSEVFDPATNTFTAAGNLLHYISSCPMVNLSNGKVLVFGIGTLFSTDREALQVFNPAANQWYLAGPVPASIFTASVYTVHQLSSGRILYVNGNFTTGNGASQYCYLVDPAFIAVGIEDRADAFNTTVYPNPAQNKITLTSDLSSGSPVVIEMFDVLGNCVWSQNAVAGTAGFRTEINLDAYQSGVYFIRTTSGETSVTHRVVKE